MTPMKKIRMPTGMISVWTGAVDAEEVSLVVRKALSGVARVHGRFGLTAALKLLRGDKDERESALADPEFRQAYRLITSPDAKQADLIGEADRMQADDSEFRKELASWVHPNRGKEALEARL